MKRSFIKAAATTALVAGALLLTPAFAGATSYTPPSTGTVSAATVAPGGTFTFSAPAEIFAPGESVTISLTGENALGASLGFVKFAIETKALGTVSAGSNGGLGAVSITLPSNASGRYSVLATSESNPTGIAAYVSTDAGAGTGTGDDGLAATGADSSALLPIWIGGGALVLAGGGLAVAATVHRNRKHEAA
ncbi:cell wall protein [Microbacterium sp. NPDC057944]|uniref:cell wall protein n=1 Tax=Microbacterium sp. NPDC057944 TaxID=3346286 RepID=UPI0036D7A00F